MQRCVFQPNCQVVERLMFSAALVCTLRSGRVPRSQVGRRRPLLVTRVEGASRGLAQAKSPVRRLNSAASPLRNALR